MFSFPLESKQRNVVNLDNPFSMQNVNVDDCEFESISNVLWLWMEPHPCSNLS